MFFQFRFSSSKCTVITCLNASCFSVVVDMYICSCADPRFYVTGCVCVWGGGGDDPGQADRKKF